MLRAPFYDPLKSYEANYDEGPFNGFADGLDIRTGVEPHFTFLGEKLSYPLGIPAGPILNSKYAKAAFKKGFDAIVYKTVRADQFPSHPFPNVLSVRVDGDLTLERAKTPFIADAQYREPLSITNSFGVPSKPSDIWLKDAKKGVASEGKGQVMIMSFMGTVREGQTADEFVADFAKAARLAKESGARIYEANLSCPNIGNEGLVCYQLDMTERVSAAIWKELGDSPLILKVGYYQDQAQLEELARIASKYAHAISSINTIAAPVVKEDGSQALPGSPVRLRSGVCGHAIKWAGLEMVKRLNDARTKLGASFSIVGVGGVTVPMDFKEYREAGADLVMSATGAMWNPLLAQEIKAAYPGA
jgi:dihydroorotate dehydrogenase